MFVNLNITCHIQITRVPRTLDKNENAHLSQQTLPRSLIPVLEMFPKVYDLFWAVEWTEQCAHTLEISLRVARTGSRQIGRDRD